MSNKDDIWENPNPLAKTWYGENTRVTVKLIKWLGPNQYKVQFGDDDCARFFNRKASDLEPLTKAAKDFIYAYENSK